ncbi:MAG: EAL domain-containing protein [Lachnospiraceae bacterium]|nr:EAL domain-containing protein [Lachnospiraceae bacterium]
MEKSEHDALDNYILENFDTALKKHYIRLFYQPIVRTLTREVCDMEVLCRWDDPKYGLLAPARFIELLERNQLIHRLDAYVVQNICREYRKAVNEGKTCYPVSCNLSRLDFELCDIISVVEDAVRDSEMPKDMLHIEVTESALTEDEELMRRNIEQFRTAGYKVWMDDFGAGYSSLNALKDFDFDVLKIDMHFLRGNTAKSGAIIRSVVSMAKELGVQTLAEGVETEEQYSFLREIGCEKVQGYLFGRPMAYEDTIRHLEEINVPMERADMQAYYDAAGRINLLSAAPFGFSSGRAAQDNGIPLAIVDVKESGSRFLYINDAMYTEMKGVDFQPTDERLNSRPDRNRAPEIRIREILDKTCTTGEENAAIVDHGMYYTLHMERIAARKDGALVLISFTNLTRTLEFTRHEKLDNALRYLYMLYDSIFLIDVRKNTAEPLYTDTVRDEQFTDRDLATVRDRAMSTVIFPGDRKVYRQFLDAETLEGRIEESGTGVLAQYFRTRDKAGVYTWKLYTLFHAAEKLVMLCIRTGNQDWAEQLHRNSGTSAAGSGTGVRQTAAGAGVLSAADLITSEKLWSTFSAESGYGIFWKDKDRRFLGANRYFLDYYGITEDQLLGRNDEEMGWHSDPGPYKKDEQEVLRDGICTRRVPGQCLTRGVFRDIEASKMPIYVGGRIVGLLGYFRDVTDEMQPKEDAQKPAFTDTVTGLLNIHGFEEIVTSYCDAYDLYGQDFAEYCLTLDNYRELSARYGRDFSLDVLQTVALRLHSRLGTGFALARYVGDTFLMLNAFSSQKSSDELLQVIEQAVSEVHKVDGNDCTLYPSVGMARYDETRDVKKLYKLSSERMLEERRRHREKFYEDSRKSKGSPRRDA